MTTSRPRWRGRHAGRRLLVAATLLAALAGCQATNRTSARPSADPHRPTIRVTSFDFAESRVLGEVYAAALEQQGYPISRLIGLGSRELVEPALEQGRVDLVPEYAGSALRFVGGTASGAVSAVETHRRLRAAMAARGLALLTPSRAEDKNGVVVTETLAAKEFLQRISDLAPLAPSLAFGAPAECPERPFCLLGLQSRYGLHFGRFVPMPSREVTVAALRSREIDVGILETTDPNLEDGSLVLLTDDRRLQPAENVVPLIRREVLTAYGPELAETLDAVSAKLTTAGLVSLNRKVTLQGQSESSVATGWLRDNDLD